MIVSQVRIDAVRGSRADSARAMDLLSGFWNAGLDEDADAVLGAVAGQLDGAEVVQLADLLRARGREQEALQLCIAAASRYDMPVVISLIKEMRDAGRIVDAHRVLESAGGWTPYRGAELVMALRLAGENKDAERVLSVVAKGMAHHVGKLVAILCEDGDESDAAEILSAFGNRGDEAVCDVVEALHSAAADTATDLLITLTISKDPTELSRLIGAFYDRGENSHADYLSRPPAGCA